MNTESQGLKLRARARRGLRRLTIGLLALTAAALGLVAPAVGSLPLAQAATNPTPVPGTGLLEDVACPTATTCVAVGSGVVEPLNVTSGGVIPGSPEQVPGPALLSAVTCPTATTCVAVGTGAVGTVGWVVPISVTNGTVTPGTAQAIHEGLVGLEGVACPTATTCVAVGVTPGWEGAVVPISVTDGTVTPGDVQEVGFPFEEENVLGRVACPTASTCVAVGTGSSPDYGGTDEAELLPISVTSGTVTAGGAQAVEGSNWLNGVACLSSTSCVAVGDAVVPIIVTNGALIPTTPEGNGANDVTCPTATTCVTVGLGGSSYGDFSVTFTTVTPGGVQPLPGTDELYGVSCPTATTCVAVGSGVVAFTLPVNSMPVVSTTSLPVATLRTPYSATLVAAGGTTPYSWSISQGSLPAGLSLDPATGVISGTPTAVGTSSFTIQVTDAESPPASATTQLSMTVDSDSATAVAAEGTDGQLWVQTPQLPSGWQPLGGSLGSAPAVVAVPQASGQASPLFIVKAGWNNTLWIRGLPLPGGQPPGSGGGWQQLGPDSTSCINNPAAVVTGTAQSPTLTVACEGSDAALYTATMSVPAAGLPNFSAWTPRGGALGAGPAVAPVNGVVTYFVTASFNDGQVWTTTNGTDWGATLWNCLGPPAAGIAQGGTTTFFGCQGGDGQLWAGPMNNVVALGGAITPGPGLGITSASDFFFAEASFGGGSVWSRTSTADWSSLGGAVLNGVGAVGLS